MSEMTIEELKKHLGEVNLIDVREKEEFDQGHIEQARNIPLSTLEYQLDAFDPAQTYHMICRSGKRSARAGDILEQRGIKTVNVTGGMLAWEEIAE